MDNAISWAKEAVFYHIYPLGMCGAPRENKGEETKGNRILEILDWIPHLKNLGVTAVYLGPIWESDRHGYDTRDYKKLDSRLGTNADFKKVCQELHKNNIRIVLDGVFNHVGHGSPIVEDVRKNRENSQYRDWIAGLNLGGNNGYNDGFCYENWGGCDELVKLNLYNENVCNYILDAVNMWISEFEIDGLRLDAADCIQKDFFRKLRAFVKEKRNDFWLMGEIIHGDYTAWANADMLDSVTNYECWKGIYSSHNDKNYFEINYAMKRQWGQGGIYQNISLYNFVDNHDVNRIGTLLSKKENLYPVYTLLFTMPGIPSIYYGSEFGIDGDKKTPEGDNALRPKLSINDIVDTNDDLLDHIRTLSQVRKTSKALCYGQYQEVVVKNEQLIFARRWNDEFAIVGLNCTENQVSIPFKYDGVDYCMTLEPYGSVIWK